MSPVRITNPKSDDAKDVKAYAWRRFIRLMPINFFAVLLGCAVANHVDLKTALGNLFFLGNYNLYFGISVPVIAGNVNLWSLNYEAFYYVLFVSIWTLNPPLKLVMLLSLAVALIGWYTNLISLFIACYAAGFLFWISGLMLAWNAKPSTQENSNWPSCLLLLLVTWKLRGLLNLLSGLPIPMFDGSVARIYYLDCLPVCIWLMSIVTQRTVPGLKWIKWGCVIFPILGLTIKWQNLGYFTPLDYRMAIGAYFLALFLWNWRPSLSFFRMLSPIGSIAFALYAISLPIQTFIFAHFQWLPANYFGLSLCVLTTSVICFGLSWYLERRIQPSLNQLFIKRRKESAP